MPMTATKLADLQAEGQKYIADARSIAERHDGAYSEWPDQAKADYDAAMAKAREMVDRIKVAKRDLDVIEQAKSLAAEIGEPDLDAGEQDRGDNLKARVKSLGLTVVESPQFKDLLTPFTKSDGQIRVPEKARINGDPIPVKSLFTGASATSAGAFVAPDRTDIVEMLGRKPLRIRNLCSNRRTTSDLVEFVRQTSHTNSAAPVPEATTSAAPTAPAGEEGGALVRAAGGGYKPEGAWAFEVVQTPVKTIAEWVPATKRALADVAALEGLINDELSADVAEAEEDQIVNGDGTGENFTGILNTSGIQTQSFATDVLTSIRKAITKARTVGRVNPNGIALNPADAEAIDLLKDANERFYFGGPFMVGSTPVWGLPVVESETVPAGTAVVADWSKCVIWDREQTTVTMTDSHEDFFVRNLVAILAEERLAFGVTRPAAIVTVDLTA